VCVREGCRLKKGKRGRWGRRGRIEERIRDKWGYTF